MSGDDADDADDEALEWLAGSLGGVVGPEAGEYPTEEERRIGMRWLDGVGRRTGGPYDEDSMLAGYLIGKLDYMLPGLYRVAVDIHLWVPEVLVPQLDLVAMRHRLSLERVPHHEVGGEGPAGPIVYACVAEPGGHCWEGYPEGSDDEHEREVTDVGMIKHGQGEVLPDEPQQPPRREEQEPERPEPEAPEGR